jgi:Rrf2 family protein
MMRLSTKGRYAARAVLEVALAYKREPVVLREIARRQEIPVRYLEQLMSTLVNAGIIMSRRGQRGGFSLVRPPSEIRLSQVVQAVEGPIRPVDCVDNPQMCNRSDLCVTRDIWDELKKEILKVLDGITLQSMIKMYEEKKAASASGT